MRLLAFLKSRPSSRPVESKERAETHAQAVPALQTSPQGEFDDVALLLERMRDATVSMSHDYNGSATTLSKQVDELSTTISVIYPTLVTLHRSSRDQEHKNQALEKEVGELTAKLRVSDEQLSWHRKRVGEVETELDGLVTHNARLGERLDRLEDDVAKRQERIARLDSELAVERRRLAERETSSRLTETRLAKREAELLASRASVAQLTNDVTEVRMSAESRQKSLSRLSDALAQEQAKAAKAEALAIQSNNELQAVCTALQRREKEADAARNRYEGEIERLKTDSRAARYTSEALQSRIDTLEKILKVQRDKLQSSSNHIAYLQSSMRNMLRGKAPLDQVDLGFDAEDRDDAQVAELASPEKEQTDLAASAETQPRMPKAQPLDESTTEQEDGRVIQIATGRKKGGRS